MKADGTVVRHPRNRQAGRAAFDGIIAIARGPLPPRLRRRLVRALALRTPTTGRAAKYDVHAATIAKWSGRTRGRPCVLGDYAFPTAAEQAGDNCSGGGAKGACPASRIPRNS